MTQAQLINRGEQFKVTEGAASFEGECVWSWDEPAGQMPRRVYPLRVIVRSIRRTGLSGMARLAPAERLRVAQLAKQLLEANEPGCEVLLWEGA